MKFQIWKIVLLGCLAWIQAGAQHITILNGSFEGVPADATMPQGWMGCQEGTTPDILPGYWGVYTQPSDGDTYLGLITRGNGTWESIGQRLSGPLKKGSCYAWSLDLAHSDTYSGHNGPVRLRVWVSKVKCQKDQLIFESPLIDHTDWETYKVKFTANEDFQYILLEAFHSEEEFSYKGNVLIDRLRAIQGCDRS